MRTTLTDEQAAAVAAQPNMEQTRDTWDRPTLRVTTHLEGGHVAWREQDGTWVFDTNWMRVGSVRQQVADAALAAVLGEPQLVEQP